MKHPTTKSKIKREANWNAAVVRERWEWRGTIGEENVRPLTPGKFKQNTGQFLPTRINRPPLNYFPNNLKHRERSPEKI
ncbi:MAG: hypothetical protein MRJ96_16415 [Nitrospirales bacterium]|nr:hypothetical protein [Nitrospira sp.]MDR4503028.1 hypothetical protein [Nitrospirales bacterium]